MRDSLTDSEPRYTYKETPSEKKPWSNLELQEQVDTPLDKIVAMLIDLSDEEIDALSTCDVFDYAKHLKKEFKQMDEYDKERSKYEN